MTSATAGAMAGAKAGVPLPKQEQISFTNFIQE